MVMCGVLPLCIESRDIAPFGMGLPPARFLNRPRNAALLALRRRVLRQPYRTINELHREVHGADMPGTLMTWPRRADALVQLSV
ncbi:glycosyl transferase, partial [Mycobacterium sp. ITM-2017-0098]